MTQVKRPAHAFSQRHARRSHRVRSRGLPPYDPYPSAKGQDAPGGRSLAATELTSERARSSRAESWVLAEPTWQPVEKTDGPAFGPIPQRKPASLQLLWVPEPGCRNRRPARAETPRQGRYILAG